MKKPIIQVLIAGALAVLAISVTAFAHHVSKLPEQAFINKLSIPQLELSSTGCDDFTCVLIEIKSQTQNFLDKEITWTSERGDIVLTPNDLNITPQTEKIETILNNFMIGTSKQEKLMIYLFGGKISYDLKTDETLLKAAFADSNIEQGTKSATYYYSNGQVQIDPEQIGYGIDTTTLSEQIQDYWPPPHI